MLIFKMDPNQIPLPAENPLENVREVVRELQLELRAQGVSKQIRDYDGQGGRKFREWLRDIERAAAVVEADDARYRAFCLMTLRGPASDFLGRTLRQRPDVPWVALRNMLREQFSDTGDSLIAKQKLLRLRQNKEETIQNFAERLFSLAEEAYSAVDLPTNIVQRQLVEILTAGLKDDHIARKLLREQPADLTQAVRLAATEYQTAKCFELCRRTEEPMDVSAVALEGAALHEL